MLAERLAPLQRERPLVLGLARGGVPVAAEVAERLGSPLDVLIVRKLGHPRHPELALGAIGEGGVTVIDRDLLHSGGVSAHALQVVVDRELAELERRVALYRHGRPAAPVVGRTVVVVDDGMATGSTVRAAILVLQRSGVRRLVVAVPVASVQSVEEVRELIPDVVCLNTPPQFRAVGEWYDDFTQVTDAEVTSLLRTGGASPPTA